MAAPFRRRRILRLMASATVHDKLSRHGVSVRHANEVLFGSPKLFRQEPQVIHTADGTSKRTPRRWLMIGPDGSGRMLTFVLELPVQRVSAIVTGMPAREVDVARYDLPGGMPIWTSR